MANRNIDPTIRKEYLNWLLTPPGEREPDTKTAFAELHEISTRTLYVWEDDEDFQAALRTIKTKWGGRFHGEIIGRLMDIVRNGSDTASVSASKLLLSHLHIPDDAIQTEDITEEQKTALRLALDDLGFKVLGTDV